MKRKALFYVLAAFAFAGCSNYEDKLEESQQQYQQQSAIDNAKKVFGTIDPNQDWNSINSSSITITANANLDDIVKVQVLTESPFFNEDAKVLCEAHQQEGRLPHSGLQHYRHIRQVLFCCSKGNASCRYRGSLIYLHHFEGSQKVVQCHARSDGRVLYYRR